MPINYPPGYVSTMGLRSDDDVLKELDRRCGYVQRDSYPIPLDQASPAPTHDRDSKSSYDIHVPRGAKRLGLKGGCGKNAKARAAASVPAR